MFWLIEHTELFFPVLLVGLVLTVETGLRLRHVSPSIDKERQSLIESARDGLTVLLSLLLGFSLPMAVPHFEQRNQLATDEADAIATVEQRARKYYPEPFRTKIRQLLREYVDARIEFRKDLSQPELEKSIAKAQHLQNEMWQAMCDARSTQP